MKKLEPLKSLLLILAGNTLFALTLVLFVLPNGLIVGGTNGIALILEYYFHIPIAVFVMGFNVVMLVLGALVLGMKFAVTTIVSSFYFPVALAFFQRHLGNEPRTHDPMLATLYAGCLIGISVGLVVREGASTGGMDIPPIILNRLFHLPVGVGMCLFDAVILLGQGTFRNIEMILYAIVMEFISTHMVDYMVLSGNQRIQVKIVSEKQPEILDLVLHEIDRGATLLHSKTGYLGRECEMVLTVVTSREVPGLRRRVQEIDPQAFLVINQVNEVRGRGFSISKFAEKTEN